MPATAKKPAAKPPNPPSRAKPIAISLVEIDRIDPSPLNRDAGRDLAPLVESIRCFGVQMPIKLRAKGERFEIVYGERRWRAAREAGLDAVPATVEDLSDEEAQARRILENTQRQDPHALEEAEAYERLLAMRDRKGKAVHTVESVAEIAGRSPAHVYHRLKLTALAPELRKAFYAGELSTTGAFLVARGIPTELQAEAWARMKHFAEADAYDDDLDDQGHLTASAIEQIIDRDYARRIGGAPFPISDGSLVPSAGACATCPKRSVNQPALFPEADRDDVCTDVACWRGKVTAFMERERREVFAVGGTVLLEEESRRVFNGGEALPWNSPWIDLDAPCHEHPDRLTWRELLGDLSPAPALAFTSQGRPVRLARRTEALAALQKNGIDLAARRPPGEPAADSAGSAERSSRPASQGDAAEARFQAEVDRTARQRLLAAVVAAAENAAPDDDRFAHLIYETVLHGGYHNALLDTVKRRVGKVPKGEQPEVALARLAEGLSGPALRALVLELCLSRGAYFILSGDKYPRDLARALEVYGVDASGIERAVTDELGAKRAARLSKADAAPRRPEVDPAQPSPSPQ